MKIFALVKVYLVHLGGWGVVIRSSDLVKIVHLLPYKPHASPHPDSSLTYIHKAG